MANHFLPKMQDCNFAIWRVSRHFKKLRARIVFLSFSAPLRLISGKIKASRPSKNKKGKKGQGRKGQLKGVEGQIGPKNGSHTPLQAQIKDEPRQGRVEGPVQGCGPGYRA